MSSLFLDDDLGDAQVGDVVILTGAEARHAATVNRLRVGETTAIGNGRGLIVAGPVLASSSERIELRAQRVEHVQRQSPRLVLVQALAKGGRDELAVQAATELGADVIVPWAAERSVSRWDAQKRAKQVVRWTSIAREASKQSLRAWLPEVRLLHETAQLAELAAQLRMLVLEPTASARLSALRFDDAEAERDLALVVGPEGGVSPAELQTLVAAGAAAVRLGEGVLRTSTAGPAAIAALSVLGGRW